MNTKKRHKKGKKKPKCNLGFFRLKNGLIFNYFSKYSIFTCCNCVKIRASN